MREQRVRAFIGLGANVGDARTMLTEAAHALAVLPGSNDDRAATDASAGVRELDPDLLIFGRANLGGAPARGFLERRRRLG